MSDLYGTERERWLDATEADGRTRDLLSAYTLMDDLLEQHWAEAEQDRDEGR